MLENQNGFQVILQNNSSWFIRMEFGIYHQMQGSEIRPGRIKSYRIRGRILYDQYEYELKLYGTNTRRYEIRPHCIFSGRIHTRSY